jgi:DNA polymerase epsilon subunit 4
MQSESSQDVPIVVDNNANETTSKNSEEPPQDTIEDDEQDIPQPSLSLPLSKIKRVFKMDPDYVAASQSAVYATGVATELFIQYFVEQASMFAKVDKRKKIQYKDFSNAVANHDALAFLSDTVPKTAPIGDLVRNKAVTVDTNEEIAIKDDKTIEKDLDRNQRVLPKGQQTLNFSSGTPIKKAVIHDLIADNNDSNDNQDVVMLG